MPQEISQQPNRAAAALAFSTGLSEKLLKQQNPPQEKEQLELEKPENTDTLKEDILSAVDEKLNTFMDTIKSALDDEEKGETKENT